MTTSSQNKKIDESQRKPKQRPKKFKPRFSHRSSNGRINRYSSTRQRKPPSGEEAISQLFTPFVFTQEDRFLPTSGTEVQKFSILKRNPIVKTALDTVRRACFWVQATVKPNPLNDYEKYPSFEKLDNKIIPFVREQLNRLGAITDQAPNQHITPNFNEMLGAMLMDGRTYGFSVAELKWDDSNGIHRLEKIKPKPPWNFDFEVDRVDELKYVVFDKDTSNKLDPNRFLIGTWEELKYGNYYGESDLLAIERDIKFLEQVEATFYTGLQNNNLKNMIAHIANNMLPANRNQLISDIESMTGGATLTVTKVTSSKGDIEKAVEFEETPDLASEDAISNTIVVVQELIKRINRALGVPDDLGNVSTAIGSFARADIQFNIFDSTVEKCQRWIEDLANRIVRAIIYYNYQNLPKDYLLPQWSFDFLEEEYEVDKANFYKTVIDSGIASGDEPFIRERLEFPPREVIEETEQIDDTSKAPGMEESNNTEENDDMEEFDKENETMLDELNGNNTLDRALEDTHKIKMAILKKKSFESEQDLQSLIFNKDEWTREKAVEWAKNNEYHSNKVDETGTSFRLRQREPIDFNDGSFRTIPFPRGESVNGLKAVVGTRKRRSLFKWRRK
jgi:hypothetical protein